MGDRIIVDIMYYESFYLSENRYAFKNCMLELYISTALNYYREILNKNLMGKRSVQQ